MTPTELAHIQNILDDPLNDGIEGPRGVYADWLDERGHGDDRERAEFIRLQIAHDHDPSVGFTWSPKWPGADLPGVVFRRGFPSSISCTLATLFGGECGRCHGRRDWFDALTGLGQCLDCNGDGRTEGIARDVFSRWPLTRIDLSCRQPIEHDSDRWGWFKHVATMDEATLPAEIWNLMTGFNNYGGYPYAIKWYPTRESAHAALSRAAVNLGRERAGLRPIAWVSS